MNTHCVLSGPKKAKKKTYICIYIITYILYHTVVHIFWFINRIILHVFSRVEVTMINGVYTCLRLKSRRAHDLLSVSARKKDFIKQQTHIFELTWNWHLDEASLYMIHIYIYMYAPYNNINCVGRGGVGPGSRVAGVSGVGMDHNWSGKPGFTDVIIMTCSIMWGGVLSQSWPDSSTCMRKVHERAENSCTPHLKSCEEFPGGMCKSPELQVWKMF